VSCAPDAVDSVLRTFHDAGFARAAAVGGLSAVAPGAAPQVRFA
jgi:selenide,water dikinase